MPRADLLDMAKVTQKSPCSSFVSLLPLRSRMCVGLRQPCLFECFAADACRQQR